MSRSVDLFLKNALLFFILLVSFLKIAQSENSTYLLPLTVTPKTYTVELRVDVEEASFSGEVTIFIRVQEEVDKISLNIKNLTIEELYLDFKDNVKFKEIEEYNQLDISTINGDSILPGEHVITVTYSGKLRQDIGKEENGFQKISYTHNDTQSYIAVSNFEPIYAREVFPCFDEPHFKAKFNLRVITKDNKYEVLSNMPCISKFETSKGTVYDFQQTVLMSPYLLTIVLTDYPHKEAIWDNDGVKTPIRIYSPNALNEKNWVVLDIIITYLDFYTNYTGIKYQLPKLDVVEHKRISGATENWGIITVGEHLLSPSLKVYRLDDIALLISHEICHFWFGNLVSDYWWNDLWLHEAFAEHLSRKAFDKVNHSNQQIQHLIDTTLQAYAMDVLQISTPVSHQVYTIEDIEKQFNIIVYTKGAFVLRMLEDVIGEAAFQKALKMYLNKFAFTSAYTDDIIKSFEEVVHDINIRDFLIIYIFQTNFPLIKVKFDESKNNYILTQRPFPSKGNATENYPNQKWTIPIRYYMSGDSHSKIIWFDKDMEKVVIPAKNSTWIKLNYDGIGFYSTVYQEEIYSNIAKDILSFSLTEQINLIREMYLLMVSNLSTCEDYLNIFFSIDDINLKKYLFDESVFNIYHTYPLLAAINAYSEENATLLEKYIVSKGNFSDEQIAQKMDNFQRYFKVLKLHFVDGIDKVIYGSPEMIKSCIRWIEANITDVPIRTTDKNSTIIERHMEHGNITLVTNQINNTCL